MDDEARAAVRELERDYDETMSIGPRRRLADGLEHFMARGTVMEDCPRLLFKLKHPEQFSSAQYVWTAGTPHLYEREG